jgi:hypothetical protein
MRVFDLQQMIWKQMEMSKSGMAVLCDSEGILLAPIAPSLVAIVSLAWHHLYDGCSVDMVAAIQSSPTYQFHISQVSAYE